MDDRYKKKNLKFDKNVCLSRNLRAVERSTARAESRHTRFSLLRCLENVENEPVEKNEESVSKIPTFGKPTLKAPTSRAGMLQKWKEEKKMKQQYDLQLKKPTFKVGFVAPKPVPTFPSLAKTTNKTCNVSDSRLKTSADSKTRFESKSYSKMLKEPNMQPSISSKSQVSSSNSIKPLNKKESGIQSANKKIPATGTSNLKVKQESHIQLPHKTNTTLQKPSYISANQTKNMVTRNQMSIKSQIVPKKASCTVTKRKVDSKLHSSSVVPKQTESKNLKPPQTLSNGISRKNQSKIGEPITSQKEFHSQLPNKSKTTLQKPSFVSSRQTKTELSSGKLVKAPEKTVTQIKQTGIPFKNGFGSKLQSKNVSKIGVPAKIKEGSSKISFRCELSHIEPAKDKFVSPKGFLFQPPTELSFSFLEDGISAIFSKLRAGTARTSTPKRADLKEIEEDDKKKTDNVADKTSTIEVFSPQDQNAVNVSYCAFSENLPEMKAKDYIPIDTTSNFDEKKTSLVEQDSLQNSTKLPDVDKLKVGEESCHAAETVSDKLETENKNPVPKNIEVSLPVFEEESPVLKDVTSSEFSHQSKSDLLDDEIPFISPMEFPESKKDIDDLLKEDLNLEKPGMQVPTINLPETTSSIFEEIEPVLPIKIPTDGIKLQNENFPTENDASVITRCKQLTRSSGIKTRSFRKSEMQPLESINESLENSSLLESPLKLPKKEPFKKPNLYKDFTPRRSLRLAKLSELTESPECLFDVRPSFYATPPDSRNGACNTSNLTYDFDKLHLENTSNEEPLVDQQRSSTRRAKVSLLYTPPTKGRVSTLRKSIRGDLMSFSPDV